MRLLLLILCMSQFVFGVDAYTTELADSLDMKVNDFLFMSSLSGALSGFVLALGVVISLKR